MDPTHADPTSRALAGLPPPAADLRRVAVYRRTVAASLPRVWENVRDWEHLPWLHRTTFASIALLEAGAWGWRARIGLQPAGHGQEIVLELLIEHDEQRYVSRTVAGPGAGGEIWTRLDAREDGRTDVTVAFDVAGVAADHARAAGERYVALYTRLWDEDESMMVRREALVSGARRTGAREAIGDPPPAASAGRTVEGAGPAAAVGSAVRALGPLAALRPGLPLIVELAARTYRVIDTGTTLRAHATVCPHMLGPLDNAPVEDGCVRCPWHGYRFDLASGRCLDAPALRLDVSPEVTIDAGTSEVTLVARRIRDRTPAPEIDPRSERR